jgi:hypothetical protein
MTRLLVEKCEYFDLHLVWISDYYDIPLAGIARDSKGNLCEFEYEVDDSEEDWRDGRYRLFEMSVFAKIRWLVRKKVFEICVGEHWTYPQRANGVMFTRKQPHWFWDRLRNFYYFLQK